MGLPRTQLQRGSWPLWKALAIRQHPNLLTYPKPALDASQSLLLTSLRTRFPCWHLGLGHESISVICWEKQTLPTHRPGDSSAEPAPRGTALCPVGARLPWLGGFSGPSCKANATGWQGFSSLDVALKPAGGTVRQGS